MTRGRGSVEYRNYKHKIEYIYQILKLIAVNPMSHTQLKTFTESSNTASFRRHIAPLVQYSYITRYNDDVDDKNLYHLTEKGRDFLNKLDSISGNLIELNHEGFNLDFVSDFMEYRSQKLKGQKMDE